MYWRYLKYVLKHKWYVMMECFKMGLYWRGIMHDMSKFRPDEFIPYARYFYGDYEPWDKVKLHMPGPSYSLSKEGVKEAFDAAWLKHQKRNPHHWQYWLLQNDTDGLQILEMPKKYALEMICDWIGAGLAITGKRDVWEWYEKNKDNMQLHPVTIHRVDIIVELQKDKYGGENS